MLKPKNTVHVTVQDYRNGKRQPAKCRTLIGTTAAEFLAKLDHIAGSGERRKPSRSALAAS